MPRRGGKRVKSRTHKKDNVVGATILEGGVQSALEKELPPRSIVARSSKVIAQVGELVHDLRKLMSPHTASNLKEKRSNRMKDYITVAQQMAVSHILTISQTKSNVVLRIGRIPSGPTLHFRVSEYSLARTVRSQQKRPHENLSVYQNPPLVVLNNFGSSEEQSVKLMKVTFQNMFPSINVKTIKLAECRRVVLFQLRKEDGLVEMRHYAVTATPVGIHKNLKKIIAGRLPNLGEMKDISEFVEGNTGAAYPLSDSEAEDETSHVQLSQKYIGRGNNSNQKSAMKLVELGPRLTLELFKVERGVCEGDVLYHKDVKKSVEEAAQLKARIESSAALKKERRAIQEQNVERKKALLEEKKANKKRRINPYSGHGNKEVDEEEDSEKEEDQDAFESSESEEMDSKKRQRSKKEDEYDSEDVDEADLDSDDEEL